MIATIQTLEAIKLLLGQPPSLAGKLLRFNGNDLKFQFEDLSRDKSCPVCSLV